MAFMSIARPLMICTFVIFLIAFISSSSSVHAGGEHQHSLGWIPNGSLSSCKGSIAECLENEEFELDTEISRRILATNRYISYGAMQRNSVPCSRRGASYYNCKSGGQANPYNRGCSAITRCRG